MARGHGRYSIAGEGSLHVIARSTTIKSLRCCLIFILIFAARISILLIATICACIFEYPDDSAINTATNTGREKYSLAGCPMYERCPFRCSQLPSRSVETCGKRLLFSAWKFKTSFHSDPYTRVYHELARRFTLQLRYGWVFELFFRVMHQSWRCVFVFVLYELPVSVGMRRVNQILVSRCTEYTVGKETC